MKYQKLLKFLLILLLGISFLRLKTRSALEIISVTCVSCYTTRSDFSRVTLTYLRFALPYFCLLTSPFFFLLLYVHACVHTKLALGINQTQCRAFLSWLKIDRHSGLRYDSLRMTMVDILIVVFERLWIIAIYPFFSVRCLIIFELNIRVFKHTLRNIPKNKI